MKKSVFVAFIIFLAVSGWLLSGQISIGNENTKEQSYVKNPDENNNDIVEKNDLLKVPRGKISENGVSSLFLMMRPCYMLCQSYEFGKIMGTFDELSISGTITQTGCL